MIKIQTAITHLKTNGFNITSKSKDAPYMLQVILEEADRLSKQERKYEDHKKRYKHRITHKFTNCPVCY